MLRSAKLGPRQPANLGPNTRTGSRTSRPGQRPPSQPSVTAANGNGNGSGAEYGTAPDPKLTAFLAEVAHGRIRPDEAARQLNSLVASAQPTGDFAATDLTRRERTGFPEVVWGPGKTPLQIATIMRKLAEQDQLAVASRIEPGVAQEVQEMLAYQDMEYIEQARMLVLRPESGQRPPRLAGTVAVLTAGTGDAFVAEECRRTAELMGCYTFRLQDLGIDSGLARIVQNLPAVRAADVVIVISGMDGSLPSAIAGLVDSPVIAVPTSVGYGAALGGISPLLSALTAGAPGVATVNIDNGFGAAMLAARILRTAGKIADKVAPARAMTMHAVAGGVPPVPQPQQQQQPDLQQQLQQCQDPGIADPMMMGAALMPLLDSMHVG